MNQTKYRKAQSERRKAADHLSIIDVGVSSSSIERLRREYDRHLDQVAGLTEATRSVYWLFIGQFLEWRNNRYDGPSVMALCVSVMEHHESLAVSIRI
jgi:hypothetical protein